MSLLRWSALLLVLLTATTLPAQKRRAAGGNGWTPPACSKITGLSSIRFVTAAGSVVKSDKQAINTHVSAIVASPIPNVLYATFQGSLYISRNAGCMWRLQANIPVFHDNISYLIATHAPRLYGYTHEWLAQIEGGNVEIFPFPERMVRMTSNRRDVNQLRAVANSGNAYESRDGGRTWTLLSAINEYLYTVAFNPSDFDHILAATTGTGRLMASRDGGRTWSRMGLPPTNVWTIEFSPRDSRIVWLQGGEHRKEDALFRSRDGGQTFERVLTWGDAGLTFSHAVMAPHPTEAETLALETHQGLALYRGHTQVTAEERPEAMTWSPSGTLYFVAPDQIIFH